MSVGLGPMNESWLRAFFAAPNGLHWTSIEQRTADRHIIDHVLQLLQLVQKDQPLAPVILPFVRDGEITGWYATTRGPAGGPELKRELMAWLGPTFLTVFDESPGDAIARTIRQRYSGTVFRFTGKPIEMVSQRVMAFAKLYLSCPRMVVASVRPIGAIRSDFERALLAQDKERAENLLASLRETGRLSEENLCYLDVRLKAGLGLWTQIARENVLIGRLSNLPLPPRVLADIMEALYRTYLDAIEATGDMAALVGEFRNKIGIRYPRLFTSRHDVRTPRVIKAFILFECSLPRPNAGILAKLDALLPRDEPGYALFASLVAAATAKERDAATSLPDTTADEAETAYDDLQYDRAFALYETQPASAHVIKRLLVCTLDINTDAARRGLLQKLDEAGPEFLTTLPPRVCSKIETVRTALEQSAARRPDTSHKEIADWMTWAEALAEGDDPAIVEKQLDNALGWDMTSFRQDGGQATRFAKLLGSLSGEAEALARRAVPKIYDAAFPDNRPAAPSLGPIALLLFDLISFDEALTPIDLELLLRLVEQILVIGLSPTDYLHLIDSLEDIQQRIGSYIHLTWSLDVAEALAIAPVPSKAAREARQKFFLILIQQAQHFARRLSYQDSLLFTLLCQDFGLEADVLGTIAQPKATDAAENLPDMSGQRIAIYSLAEAAASRAKTILQAMFPTAKVETNSDKVATPRLKSLAKAADLFVFAWKSSSHQAYYCVKDAMAKSEPLMATGKGTASILRAVLKSQERVI